MRYHNKENMNNALQYFFMLVSNTSTVETLLLCHIIFLNSKVSKVELFGYEKNT